MKTSQKHLLGRLSSPALGRPRRKRWWEGDEAGGDMAAGGCPPHPAFLPSSSSSCCSAETCCTQLTSNAGRWHSKTDRALVAAPCPPAPLMPGIPYAPSHPVAVVALLPAWHGKSGAKGHGREKGHGERGTDRKGREGEAQQRPEAADTWPKPRAEGRDCCDPALQGEMGVMGTSRWVLQDCGLGLTGGTGALPLLPI